MHVIFKSHMILVHSNTMITNFIGVAKNETDTLKRKKTEHYHTARSLQYIK